MAGEAGCMHEAEVELGLRANTCTHTSWWANRRPAAAPAGHDSEVASIAWPRLAVGLHGSPPLLGGGAGRVAQPVGYCTTCAQTSLLAAASLALGLDVPTSCLWSGLAPTALPRTQFSRTCQPSRPMSTYVASPCVPATAGSNVSPGYRSRCTG